MAVRPGTFRGGFERRLYMGAALAAVLVVFVGFARTYYLKTVFGGPPWRGAWCTPTAS